ncbi:MAG: hypothetical protein K2P84_03285, partial [Undibacterium sp.]|nr:hypothetical protein [Undibacterium sp.]
AFIFFFTQNKVDSFALLRCACACLLLAPNFYVTCFYFSLSKFFEILNLIAEHEGIDIAIAEQEPASPVQSSAAEPIEQEVQISTQETKPIKARKAPIKPPRKTAENEPNIAPFDQWPFPTAESIAKNKIQVGELA